MSGRIIERQWFIHSNDRATGSTPEDCEVDVHTNAGTHVRSIALTHFSMPWYVYNITAALGNNTITIGGSAAANAETVTVPDGHYTFTRLAQTIEDLLAATSPINTVLTAFVCTYDGGTDKFTIDADGGGGGETFQIVSTTLSDQLGFTGTDVDTNKTAPVEATNNPYIPVPHKISILFPGIQDSAHSANDHRSTTLAEIPVDVAYGDVIHFEPATPQYKVVANAYNRFHIRLMDHNNVLLVNQNRPWQMVLNVQYVSQY